MIKLLALAAVVAFAVAQQGGDQHPPYLASASPAVKKQFEGLFVNAHTLTDAQMDAKIKGWVNQQSPQIKAAFAAFERQIPQFEAQANAARQQARARMTPAARAADDRLWAITSNKGLTQQQKQQQAEAIYSTLPSNVRAELERIGQQGGR